MTIKELEKMLKKAETLEQKMKIKDQILALRKAKGEFTEKRQDEGECLMCSS